MLWNPGCLPSSRVAFGPPLNGRISSLSICTGDLAMLVIPGQQGKATCDGMTRRELLRVGGSALLGLTLADILRLQGTASAAPPAASADHGPGWNRARSVILLYLQGGPSHLDLWDPKDNVPERVRSTFSA